MTHKFRNRSRLLGGCASAAVALALILAPERAAAQGIQATGDVVLGSATIIDTGPTTTTVNLTTPTVVINWTPTEDANNDALPFIAAGSTGFFRSDVTPNFAVLNRILPSTNNNVLTINGAVLSQFFDGNGLSSTAGLVAFSSPTGIVAGNNAIFDVGRLLLTTLDVSNTSFQTFAAGGNLALNGANSPTAQVLVNPGAQIIASPDNAFFAVVAAGIEMRGTATVNGSHAYVVGEVVNLSFSNGLFNISVPVGTAASGEVLTVNGNVGGPSSTGVGDNHMIYGVAHAAADPISMLFSGNLGFAPAATAGVINGEIILAANYNVVGRSVAGGTISDGIGATFRSVAGTSNVRADIQLEDFDSSSSLLAIGTHAVQATATAADSSVVGNLLLVGRESADLSALFGRGFDVDGDVLVDARDYGVVSSTLSMLDEINAQGGNASISADFAGGVTITGDALVTADAFGGADDLNLIAGSAQGGGAFIGANDTSLVSITGSATISARGLGITNLTVLQGAEARGGFATLAATDRSSVGIGSNLVMRADAEAANGSLTNASTVSNAYGGTAQISSIGDLSAVTIGGEANLSARAAGGNSNNAGAGSIGDGGFALLVAQDQGFIDISLTTRLETEGVGGDNAGGIGGVGLGGRSTASVGSNGRIALNGNFSADSLGDGGNGQTGGAGFGGAAGAIVATGEMTISGTAFAGSEGVGGNASIGFGGNGGFGSGGLSLFQATGTLVETASILIGGSSAVAFAQGVGGNGGAGGGPGLVPSGRGGDARGGQFGVPNQSDANLPNSGAYFVAGGDNGSITITGQAVAVAQAYAGDGGNGTGVAGGNGGGALGGVAVLGVTINGFAGLDGSVGLGTADFSTILIQADAVGGQGGFTDSTVQTGNGGEGRAGFGSLTATAGDVTAAEVQITVTGFGGDGNQGGIGRGGTGGIDGGLGGSITATEFQVDARGIGGTSGPNASTLAFGNAFGGTARILANGLAVDIDGDILLDASANGGLMEGAAQGGRGTGGTAFIQADATDDPASVNITGHTLIFANGTGGSALNLGIGGDGEGGIAYVEAQAGSDIALGSTQVTAVGRGGASANSLGGAGTGGQVRLVARAAGSSLTVARNVPSDFANLANSFNMLSADGIAAEGRGGSAVSTNGIGGRVEIGAVDGGAVRLPTQADIANDPNSAAPELHFVARGFGGNASANLGTGGNGFGGIGLIVATGTGSQLIIGPNLFSVFGQGGSSAQSGQNITGGNGFGGTRRIAATLGSTMTYHGAGGISGGLGGDGSLDGNGGIGRGGDNQIVVFESTLNVIGTVSVENGSRGGSGTLGGGAFDDVGGILALSATNSVINMQDAGPGAIRLGGTTIGGDGDFGGGAARTSQVSINLTDTTVLGGSFTVDPVAIGGNGIASIAGGGNATSNAVQVDITGSDLTLSGPMLISSEARGGAGGLGGTSFFGGAATSRDVTVNVTGSSLGVVGDLRVQSIATGGPGGNIGNATSGDASLVLLDSVVSATALLEVAARATAAGSAGQTGGIATSGAALLEMGSGGTLDAGSVLIDATALTSPGGTARGGSASLTVGSGFAHILQATDLNLQADGTGAASIDARNGAGRFAISVGSGSNVNLANLTATAQGDTIFGSPVPSVIEVLGGNLNVSDSLIATALGDITITLNGGGLIGELPISTTVTNIFVSSSGTISVEDDNSGSLGIGGNAISLNAGRSILLDGIIASNDGTIGLFANVGSSPTLPDPAEITMSAGSSLDAGNGSVAIVMDSGAPSGGITLSNISAGTIGVRNFGEDPGSDITVLATGVLTASGTGRAIDLAALGGEVINLHGDAGLILTGGGHFGIFAATPTGSQIGSFANYARRYNVGNSEDYDDLDPGGNFAAFRLAPRLTVTADDIIRLYGNDLPALTATITGFQPGDSIADLLGAPGLATAADSTSNVGLYEITAALGTLVSEQGYQFDFAPGTLTVSPRPITVTADDLSRFYGNANPPLTFTVGGLGLVNGDEITGALATTADATTGVGNVAITQGTIGASNNYDLTFVEGVLTITPRPITVTADNLSRIYGNANPALTFTVGGLGLVNGDQLTGALATTADQTTSVGNVAITQGSVGASGNYALTFVNGALTITPRPITVTADNLSRIYGDANPALTFTVGGLGLVNGDQITGTPTTTANSATGVGSYAITQGTLAPSSNYSLTFVNGTLAITPRPITITADDLVKLLGQADPALTFAVGGAGLVNGDTFSGRLARDEGEMLGSFAIQRGSLDAGPNYTATFVPGTLTIEAPPTPGEVTNTTALEPADGIGEVPPPPLSEEEEEELFGMDFPSQPDAQLIAEDGLLDEPVTSGGDASLYGSSDVPGTGGGQ